LASVFSPVCYRLTPGELEPRPRVITQHFEEAVNELAAAVRDRYAGASPALRKAVTQTPPLQHPREQNKKKILVAFWMMEFRIRVAGTAHGWLSINQISMSMEP
jgi:hypothetical protein